MAMAYDPVRGQIVLFGGAGNSEWSDETWTWDGVNWTLQHPTKSPPADCCIGMSFDAATHKVVLSEANIPGTWSWDGTTWTEEHPARRPSIRYNQAVSRSASHILLFGGEDCFDDYCYFYDTWIWTGSTWTNLSRSPHPGARSRAGMAYDVFHRQVVLFGGSNENGVWGDTWIWNGQNWTKQSPANSPSPRPGLGMTYDSTNGEVVLFGGGAYLGDTWAWNGLTWICKAGCT
jgi:hypothetical protein